MTRPLPSSCVWPLLWALLWPMAAQAREGHLVDRDAIRQIYTSSTAEDTDGRQTYRASHLLDGRDWSAWGSEVDDTSGAWIEVVFERVEYLAGLEFVPGDARGKDKFSACGRPARLRIQMGDQVVERQLKDERWRQRLTFSQPIFGRRVRIEVQSIHGRARAGGVCISELRFRAPDRRLSSLPHLQRRLKKLTAMVEADASTAELAEEALPIGAPAVGPLVRALDPAQPERAVRLLDVLGRLGARSAAGPIEAIYRRRAVSQGVKERALWALGSLGLTRHLPDIKAWYARATGGDRELALDAWASTGDPEALPVLLEALERGATPARRVAATRLGRFPAEEVVASLEGLLSSESSSTRAWAVRALGRVSHARRDALLRHALDDHRESVVLAALEAQVASPTPSLVEAVREKARAGSFSVRGAAMRVLGAQRHREDMPLLIRGTRDPVPLVRQGAAEALGSFVQHQDARAALATLALSFGDSRAAAISARALAEGPTPEWELTTLLGSPHSVVRAEVGKALLSRGEAGSEALLTTAVHNDPNRRRGALEVLRGLPEPPVMAIVRATERAPSDVQVDLLTLLAEAGDPAAASLALRLARSGQPRAVRQSAIAALGRCGPDAQVYRTLVGGLSDPEPMVQYAAVLALGERRSPSAVKPLGELLSKTNSTYLRHAVVQALGRIGRPEVIPLLTHAYTHHLKRDHDDRDLRAMIVLTASRVGGRESLSLLVEAMADDDPRVRAAAQRGLASPTQSAPGATTPAPTEPPSEARANRLE